MDVTRLAFRYGNGRCERQSSRQYHHLLHVCSGRDVAGIDRDVAAIVATDPSNGVRTGVARYFIALPDPRISQVISFL